MEGRDFNEKLGSWLDESYGELLASVENQERFLEIASLREDDDYDVDDIAMIKEVFGRILKLSFIMKGHPYELENLVRFLCRQ